MNESDDKKKGTGAGAAVGAVAGGVAGGAAAGAAVGGMTGPVGALVGAAVGAVVGAVGGRGAGAAKDAHDAGTLGTSGSTHSGRQLHTVIGAFDDPSAAQRAVDRLTQSGFDRDDVHVQHQQGQSGDPNRTEGFFPRLLAGDDAGQGMQDHSHAHHAALYEEAVRRGNAVVVVDAHDEEQADRASSLLHELGAVDVDERSKQWRAEGWNPQPQRMQGGSDLQGRDGKLDVVQEELQVGKREVDRGGVRIVQRMSQKPVREIVHLREEHARVDRRPVDRPASPDELTNLGQGTVEIRERAEVPVVGKTARVVEEVSVGKEVREHDETIEDTVRRKDVDIERLEGSDRTMRDERAFAADPNRERMLREEQDRASSPRSPMDPDKPR